MLQVEVSVEVEHALVMEPAGLLGYRMSPSGKAPSRDNAEPTGAALMLTVPQLSVYLRLHDYFMGECGEGYPSLVQSVYNEDRDDSQRRHHPGPRRL